MDLFETFRACHGNRSLQIEITFAGTVIIPIGISLEDGLWTVHRGDEQVGAFSVKNGAADKMVKKTPDQNPRVFVLKGDPEQILAQLLAVPVCPKTGIDLMLAFGDQLRQSDSKLVCSRCNQVHEHLPEQLLQKVVDQLRNAVSHCGHGHSRIDELTAVMNGPEDRLRDLGYASRNEAAEQRDRLQGFLQWADVRVPRTVNPREQAAEA